MMMRRHGLLLSAAWTLCLALLVAGGAHAQSIDPTRPYRTAETTHFRITYTPELEPLVAHTARVAEAAYTLMAEYVRPAPDGTIDLLLSDAADITNGYAMAVPSNRIVVFVNPPVEELSLQNYRDWLDLVVTHELAHIFHMESAGAFGRFIRGLFGRLPLAWPVFPAGSMPAWATEGLAVEMESLTGAGRLHGSYHEMVVRTAVLEDRLDPIDRVSHETAKWPGGQRFYIYGSLFLDYISRTYGGDARKDIVSRTGASILPPEFALNHIGRQATGKSFTALWREWGADLARTYTPLFDSLRAAGITRTEKVAGAGRVARHPRVSPDGSTLAFAEDDGRSVAHTRAIDLATGRTAWKQRRTGIAAASWLPDNTTLITSQVEISGAYRLRADLFTHEHGGEERLTKGLRLQDPDIDRDGRRVIAVQNEAGATRLVLLSPDGGNLRAITEYSRDAQWSHPRWSPDGSRIAVVHWRDGNQDIVVVDSTGTEQVRFTDDPAVDDTPVWSPDGHFVLFRSDRTGIPNIFAGDVTQPASLFQVTNVATGAYDPEVSPDAKHLYMSVYHADGFAIERAAYDPASWRPAPAPRAASYARSDCADVQRTDALPQRAATDSAFKSASCVIPAPLPPAPVSPTRAYNPLQTLRPFYWLPLAYSVEQAGTFIGASTSGRDLLGRHGYAAELAVDPASGRTAGAIAYSYAGIDRTALGISAVRDWDYLGLFRAIRPEGDTSIVNGIEREDIAQVTASYLHRRVRNAANFTIGAEVVRRRRVVADSGHIRFANPLDHLWGPIARVSFANTRSPAHAISPEDGISLQVAGRMRFDRERDSRRGYSEVTTWNTAYRSVDFGGFAHHVIAMRISALYREGTGATPSGIGGVPGVPIDLGVAVVGSGTELLPVRGFEEGDRFGTRAWTASLEYRVPLAFPARGKGTWPVFLDRLSTAVFADAGNASCTREVAQLFVCPDGDPLVSVGAELNADVALGFVQPFRARFGVAQPISGPRTRPRAYIGIGRAF